MINLYLNFILWLVYVNDHTGPIHTVTRNSPIITTKGNEENCDKTPIETLKNNLKINYPYGFSQMRLKPIVFLANHELKLVTT